MYNIVKKKLFGIVVALAVMCGSVAGCTQSVLPTHVQDNIPQVEITDKAQKLTDKAQQGDEDAQFNLGVLYEQGQGVMQDYAKAIHWYEKSAKQNDAEAQGRLGVLYQYGKGVPQDYAKAAYWYKKSAGHGNADAQRALGYLYEQGLGVSQDMSAAFVAFYFAAANSIDYKEAEEDRDNLIKSMNKEALAQAKALLADCQTKNQKCPIW